eukprot:scaffold233_cov174-Ochromonas_danica.AAC.60
MEQDNVVLEVLLHWMMARGEGKMRCPHGKQQVINAKGESLAPLPIVMAMMALDHPNDKKDFTCFYLQPDGKSSVYTS